jgi:prophage regulatory protein
MIGTAFKYDATLELWRLPKVLEKTSLSESTIWRSVKAGTFPEPRRVGISAVAWLSSEVVVWMQALPVASADRE